MIYMQTLRYLCSILLTLIVASRAVQAQQSDFEGWFQYLANIGLDEERDWILTLEEQAQLGDDWKRLSTNILRTMVNYNWTEQFSTGGGYMWGPMFYNSQYHRIDRDENRTFVQLMYRHDLWDVQWIHRFRQEQRFIEDTRGAVSNRGRYMIRGSYGLSDDKNFGLTAYNELYINYNGVYNGPTGGYDQDRLFFGPYWRVDNARYEVGFLEQHTQRFGLEPRWAQVLMFMASFDY